MLNKGSYGNVKMTAKRLLWTVCVLLCATHADGEAWRVHLAYNDISQVLMSRGNVYVLSGGSMYSLDSRTEQRKSFTLQDGLSETGISYIYNDSARRIFAL